MNWFAQVTGQFVVEEGFLHHRSVSLLFHHGLFLVSRLMKVLSELQYRISCVSESEPLRYAFGHLLSR